MKHRFREFFAILDDWTWDWNVPPEPSINSFKLERDGAIRYNTKTGEEIVITTHHRNKLYAMGCPYPVWTLPELRELKKVGKEDIANILLFKKRFRAEITKVEPN